MPKRKARILLVGGGSGGHVLPLLAVAEELLKSNQELDLRVWCDKKTFALVRELFANLASVKVECIAAGKLRRYHHLKWWQHLQPAIFWPNFKDVFRIGAGFCQSFLKLLVWRPAVIFCKGGYVGLPVGLIGALLRIKLIIHDSDTLPGLTNRILSRFASKIATGFPVENYPTYPPSKLRYTGIPIKAAFRPISSKQQLAFKQKLGFNAGRPLVLAVGGGLGAVIINDAMLALAKILPDFQLVLATGEFDSSRVEHEISSAKITNLLAKSFFSNIDKYILSADLVICRAGATTLVELARAKKLTIVVPNPKLAGGHQLKNAESLAKINAVDVVLESELKNNPDILRAKITELLALGEKERQARLEVFASIVQPDASRQIAQLIRGEISNA